MKVKNMSVLINNEIRDVQKQYEKTKGANSVVDK